MSMIKKSRWFGEVFDLLNKSNRAIKAAMERAENQTGENRFDDPANEAESGVDGVAENEYEVNYKVRDP